MAGLVGGEAFSIDANPIKGDVAPNKRAPGEAQPIDWPAPKEGFVRGLCLLGGPRCRHVGDAARARVGTAAAQAMAAAEASRRRRCRSPIHRQLGFAERACGIRSSPTTPSSASSNKLGIIVDAEGNTRLPQ